MPTRSGSLTSFRKACAIRWSSKRRPMMVQSSALKAENSGSPPPTSRMSSTPNTSSFSKSAFSSSFSSSSSSVGTSISPGGLPSGASPPPAPVRALFAAALAFAAPGAALHSISSLFAAVSAAAVVVGMTMPPIRLKFTHRVGTPPLVVGGCVCAGNMAWSRSAPRTSASFRAWFLSDIRPPGKLPCRPPWFLKQRVSAQYMRYRRMILSCAKYLSDLSASSVASSTVGRRHLTCRLMKPWQKPLISPFRVEMPSVHRRKMFLPTVVASPQMKALQLLMTPWAWKISASRPPAGMGMSARECPALCFHRMSPMSSSRLTM
mmetsp:Transcript_69251/g.195229  ORF Transcript_69251/g.195229 Transcript_69251/m.195229 type:complete len:320 (-) Transcript_69251:671-1630(-)